MTNLDRNTRTLIVCFTLALMGLIPLRFVEVGQSPAVAGQAMLTERPVVLGETMEVAVEAVETRSPAILEAPYDEIDGAMPLGEEDCLDADEAGRMIDELTGDLVSGNYDEIKISEILLEAEKVEARICR